MVTSEVKIWINEIAATGVQAKLLMPKVSAVIITYNEEQNIKRTLAKLAWCDEIIIVDSYSTDNTISLAKSFGCKVFYKQFEGYGSQKQFAVSKAANDWILCIDADEVLTDQLVEEMKSALVSDHSYAGFSCRMNMVFLDKEFRYGKESERYFIRLFNKKQGGLSEDKVHESIRLNGEVKKLQHTIRHYSYTSLHQCLEKTNRYSSYSAEMAFSKGKNKSLPAILFGLPFNFFKYYLLELNCLNGRKGFYWSVFLSYYHFAKYVKLNELNRQCANLQSVITI